MLLSCVIIKISKYLEKHLAFLLGAFLRLKGGCDMPRKFKWEIFVDKVVGGMSQRQAYKSTFACKKMSDEQIDSEASALLNGTGKYAKYPKASQRYKELNEKAQKEADDNAIADATEVLKYLTSVMRKESQSDVLARDETGAERPIKKLPDEKECLRAAELLGKRYGLYTDKIEADVDTDLNITITRK